jgi:hypothetical protein
VGNQSLQQCCFAFYSIRWPQWRYVFADGADRHTFGLQCGTVPIATIPPFLGDPELNLGPSEMAGFFLALHFGVRISNDILSSARAGVRCVCFRLEPLPIVKTSAPRPPSGSGLLFRRFAGSEACASARCWPFRWSEFPNRKLGVAWAILGVGMSDAVGALIIAALVGTHFAMWARCRS